MQTTPSGEVRVRYRPTAEDHLALYRQQVGSHPTYRAARIGVTVLAVLLIAVVLVPRGVGGLIGAALVGVAVIGLWVVGPALAHRRIAGIYREGSTPAEVEYRVDDQGVHGRTAWAAWSDVAGADETADAFVITMRPGAGAYLPKRVIADADLALLRTLLETHVGSRARLRSD
jgi:hypothetical protein